MAPSSSLLRTLRTIHLYVGVLTAPALLFFAFTGALQTAGLHESQRGSSYQPPRWAVVLGQLHKKQTTVVPERRPSPPPANQASPTPGGAAANQASARPPKEAHAETFTGPSPVPLKAFFLLVCLGLASSTVTGIYMAFRYRPRRISLILGLLIAGTILPILLAFL